MIHLFVHNFKLFTEYLTLGIAWLLDYWME